MIAPTLVYMFASEVIDGTWDIENVPAMLRDDVIELIERMTGKSVGEN